MRLAQLLGALDVFLTDVEQPDARVRKPVQIARQHGAHRGELDQVVCRAVGIGAEIEHHRVPMHRGNRRDDRRPIDALDHPEHEARGREQCARVAGADAGCGGARFHQVDRDAHRGVLLASQRVLRTLVHADDFAGLDESAALRRAAPPATAHAMASARPTRMQLERGLRPRGRRVPPARPRRRRGRRSWRPRQC